PALGFAYIRDEVNAGRRWVDAPEDDERRFWIILVGHRRHLAVERHIGCTRGCRAHGSRQTRRAGPAPELGVEVVLRQQPARSVDVDHFAALNGDSQAAGVWAIKRTGRVDDCCRSAEDWFGSHEVTIALRPFGTPEA